MKRKYAVIVAAVLVLGALTTGFAVAAGGGEGDKPLSGTTYERAADAALEHTGGGKVVETEVGDEGAAYSVEVRLSAGRTVEVNLNRDFEVTGQETDDDRVEHENEGAEAGENGDDD